MHVARGSWLRTAAGSVAGVTIGCGVTVSTLVLLAELTSMDGRYSSWLEGGGVIQLGFGPAIIIGAYLGAWLGRRYLWQEQRSPWPRRPRGVVLNHYPAAMVGAAILGPVTTLFTLPAARVVVDAMVDYAELIMPRIVFTTQLLMYAVVFIGALSVARSTLHLLDRDIYARRKMRDALRALGAMGG